jgi:hypothetical protein
MKALLIQKCIKIDTAVQIDIMCLNCALLKDIPKNLALSFQYFTDVLTDLFNWLQSSSRILMSLKMSHDLLQNDTMNFASIKNYCIVNKNIHMHVLNILVPIFFI